jgi:gamma-glutamylcyclotransferase
VRFPASASRLHPVGRIVGTDEGDSLLYFAYSANIDPARLTEVSPDADFEFIAHLPEWKMEFTIANGKGGIPSVRPLPGNTVWGAVFSIPDGDLDAIDAREADEGRTRVETQAMDREGRRHDVVTHVSANGDGPELDPEPTYLGAMVRGGRHWNLPAGWVMALEEHLG